jgi:glycosyltransferase involved in cell wall biosynthesis
MTHLVIAVKTADGALWILPHVREARRRGRKVTVLTPDGDGRLVRALRSLSSTDPGISHRVSPFEFSFRRPWRAVRGLWRLRRTIRDLAPTVVLYHLYASALAVRIASIGLRLRRVHMVAGPLYLESTIIRLIERVLARLDDLIICGSEYTRRSYLRLGLPQRRLVTVPYGVDLTRFRPLGSDREAVRRRLGLDEYAFVVGMVAYVYAPKSLVYNGEGIKGHRYLLQAWERFRQRHPDAQLLLVGSGFDAAGEAYRRRLMADHGVAPGAAQGADVHWLSTVADVRDAYTAMDVSVSPSLSDNHGAVLEASAMGVPSIVSDAGALPETVTSESGWVFPAGSTEALLGRLEAAYLDWTDGRLADRGRAARRYVSGQFDVAELSRQVISCLDE